MVKTDLPFPHVLHAQCTSVKDGTDRDGQAESVANLGFCERANRGCRRKELNLEVWDIWRGSGSFLEF